MKRLLLLAVLLMSFVTFSMAKHIDLSLAKKVGASFLLSTNAEKFRADLEFDLVYKAQESIANAYDVTYFYVFNVGKNGFVIVAGDDNVQPILGYSDEGIFDPDNIPANASAWLEEYKYQIRYVVENKIPSNLLIQQKWEKYINGSIDISKSVNGSLGPLMSTKWDQRPFYNELCPGGSVTGCVATAMAQIMKYWEHPKTGTGFHSYYESTYGTLSANFGGTNYDWASMPDELFGSNMALATLMYHCGVSVEMEYSPQVSGAFVISDYTPPNTEHCSEYAFKNYFGYKKTSKGILRNNYDQQSWVNILREELDAQRPLLYAGFGSGGGHAFVCDGYDEGDYFHFNWGWGGFFDGFFYINALNPDGTGTGGGSGGYNDNHQVIIGLEPDIEGGSTGGFDLSLNSEIVMQDEFWFIHDEISLVVEIVNRGSENFNGDIGAAIFDVNGVFLDFIEILSGTLPSNSNQQIGFSRPGAAFLVPGTYLTAIFYKLGDGDWTIVNEGNYTNLKQYQIIYSTKIETNSDFVIAGQQLYQGESAEIRVDVLNTSSTNFFGRYRVSLSNIDGSLAQSIQIVNESNGLKPNQNYTNGLSFSGNITVSPGTYLMEIAYQDNGTTDWYYAGSSSFSNPVFVTVQNRPFEPDKFESNDTVSEAYILPTVFANDIAPVNSNGSNFHIGTDIDFYRIDLPTGYKYNIDARLHDVYNSGDGNSYSVDAAISYSLDGTTWSNVFDDVVPTIEIENGGTLYFQVSPFFPGKLGTYKLDAGIIRFRDGDNDNLAYFTPYEFVIAPFSGGFYNGAIESNTDWRLVISEYDKKWITILSNTSGNSSDFFDLEIKKNNYPINRYASIALIYNNNLDTTYFNISQPSENSGYLNVPAEMSSLSDGGSLEFDLFSDLEWELDEANKPAWVTFSPVKGRGFQIVTATFAENTAGNNRTGSAKFIAKLPDGGTIEKEIILSQFRSAEGIYHFTAFPNPTNDKAVVQFPVMGKQLLNMRIVDPTGRVVKALENNRHVSDNFNEIYSMNDLASGIYIIQVQLGEKYHTQKLLIID